MRRRGEYVQIRYGLERFPNAISRALRWNTEQNERSRRCLENLIQKFGTEQEPALLTVMVTLLPSHTTLTGPHRPVDQQYQTTFTSSKLQLSNIDVEA